MPAINDFDSLPTLEYDSKFLEPLQEGYDLDGPFGSKVTSIPGGLPWTQRNTINNAQIVKVSYELSDSRMVDWFQMWYKVWTREGSIPIRCKLSLGESMPVEYAAVIMNAPVYKDMRGYYSVVTFTLAAEKIVDDYDFQDSLLWMIKIYGYDGAIQMINMFEQYATIDSNVLRFGPRAGV